MDSLSRSERNDGMHFEVQSLVWLLKLQEEVLAGGNLHVPWYTGGREHETRRYSADCSVRIAIIWSAREGRGERRGEAVAVVPGAGGCLIFGAKEI